MFLVLLFTAPRGKILLMERRITVTASDRTLPVSQWLVDSHDVELLVMLQQPMATVL